MSGDSISNAFYDWNPRSAQDPGLGEHAPSFAHFRWGTANHLTIDEYFSPTSRFNLSNLLQVPSRSSVDVDYDCNQVHEMFLRSNILIENIHDILGAVDPMHRDEFYSRLQVAAGNEVFPFTQDGFVNRDEM
jgi:hypothetical protein